jgi:hypothetical protein
MPRIQATGETPPALPRGAVTPPPTFALGLAAWIAAYAGLSSFATYVAGLVGISQRRWFGSFQTSHRRTQGYRSAAAVAKPAMLVPLVGA